MKLLRLWNLNRRFEPLRIVLTSWRNFLQTRRRYTDLNQAEDSSPARFFASPDPQSQNQRSGEKKGRTMNPLTYLKKAPPPFLIPLALAWLALSPTARAVDPPPDGGYPNENTAEGEDALFRLTTGIHNTACGYEALYTNTSGRNNTGLGWAALRRNTVGYRNTATGCDSLTHNKTGFNNAGHGSGGLKFNTTGSNNTSNGADALNSNTTGNNNTASGQNALSLNTTGSDNIALGISAGANLTTGDNNIEIGNPGIAGEANTIRLGSVGTQTATFVAGISGTTVTGGVGVIIDNNGKLGTVVSSARFKDAIKPMDKASEAILALKPVTFRYKHELDSEGAPQFGLVAEQVEKINPDLVARDEEGKVYTVRYEAVNAMLLNEFLKEHRKNEEQGVTIARLEKQIEALTAGLQKVSAQLELSKPAPRAVLSDR
jgi:trimeric autotransporter adhesin